MSKITSYFTKNKGFSTTKTEGSSTTKTEGSSTTNKADSSSRSRETNSHEGFFGDPHNHEEAKRYLDMDLKEKRTMYNGRIRSKGQIELKDVDNWSTLGPLERLQAKVRSHKEPTTKKKEKQQFLDLSARETDQELNDKVSLWQGDITQLEIDAIVNAANRSMLGGGGVDGCIHEMAGKSLRTECKTLNGADTGQAKITSGHRLPAKYILHTVGPMGENPTKLEECYKNCLKLMKEYKIRTVAFCCISTGVYDYPNKPAAIVALDTIRKWMENNRDQVDRIIFCTYLNTDYEIYTNLMTNTFFPLPRAEQPDKPLNEASVAAALDSAPSPPSDWSSSSSPPSSRPESGGKRAHSPATPQKGSPGDGAGEDNKNDDTTDDEEAKPADEEPMSQDFSQDFSSPMSQDFS